MFQNILALLFILKLVKHSKFYAPRYKIICINTGLLKLWVAKQIGILCFVPQNFENSSSAAELLEKIMVIVHLIGKSENLGTKVDKLELNSECGPFF